MAKLSSCRASIVDRLIALQFAVFAIPIVMLVSILVRLASEGPVFVTDPRLFGGRLVALLRFRTTGNGEAARFIGRFLEQFGIDRIPALSNVIRGDLTMRDYFQFVDGQN